MGSVKEEPVTLQRFQPLYLISNTAKGRGVFAGRDIASGTTIDMSPVLVLDPKENTDHIEKTALYHYTYNWPTAHGKTQAVVFGLGSLFNHSTHHQNVGWLRDLKNELVIYCALRDISEGEELCISYGAHLTFEDADKQDLEAEAEAETAEDLLRIQLD
ncbi:hypothetical protein LTR56_007862 [Elasticomyces elasticus]|nr:hypothetical protein LTR56_007862 [Elasticomyces elasticus]KAK3667911.1 hypothetical protein LTR22_001356 [Elasticomyces elasticus]KAK4932095.1 hypothetical protein LTR49_001392 [Elasticomyces elasticus]KAK5745835.1 hypothetical protein LTS12_022942 [Elasticomyces elasticus]